MKKRALNPIHIKYRADFEPGRASCTVHVQTICGLTGRYAK